MSLADRIEALRKQAAPRQPEARAAMPAQRPALHDGGRFARWHVAESTEHESDSWLLTYLDLITLLLAMFVVLLGLSQLPKTTQAATAPVELVGSVAPPDTLPAAWENMGASVLASLRMADAPQASWLAARTAAPAEPDAIALAAPTAPAAADVPVFPPEPDPAPAPPAGPPAVPAPEPPSIADLGLEDLGDGVDVIVNEQSISFRINNELLFPSGQAVLSDSGLRVIQRMATVINRSQGYPVSVEGHSDAVPIQTRQFPSNWELSAGRATSVLRALVRDGVDAARLRAVGYADTHPIGPNDTAAGRASNRRVELIMEITPRQAAAAATQDTPREPARPAAHSG